MGSDADFGVIADPWQALRRHTDARIALGRAGHALPTSELLRFQLAHAQARDAVQQPVDFAAVAAPLQAQGLAVQTLHSLAPDRATYLRRPDLGRLLDNVSRSAVDKAKPTLTGYPVLAVIGDGLSAAAAECHAAPMLLAAASGLRAAGIVLCPTVFLARQARVALADEVGEPLQARLTVMLIGERPGLSSPDSLGIYLTYAPCRGRRNAERNCISNIRAAGLSYAQAAGKLVWLVAEALRLQLSGVALKDDSGAAVAAVSSVRIESSLT